MVNGIKNVTIRLKEESELFSSARIGSPTECISVIAEQIANLDREAVYALNLNVKNQPINICLISLGTINESFCSPRDVFKSAILSNAYSIIVIHNHPSGDSSPSDTDLETYTKLRNAGDIIGIQVLDSIVIGKDSFYSINSKETYDYK